MKTKLLIISAIILFTQWQCTESTTEPVTDENSGSIRIILVDSPASLDSLVVCVSRVEVHKSGADTTEAGWTVINDSLRYFDLLQLQNGASAVLGDTSLTEGKYTQIRLIVEDNSYVIESGMKYPLIIPSGSQSGIKLNHSFDIEAGKLYELYLDFDADKSVILTGSGDYILQPVIRLVPVVISGTISGQVLPVESDPTITAFNSVDTITTFTDMNGFFTLMAVPEGIYDVSVLPADTSVYIDTTLTSIIVTANQNTDLGIITLHSK
ncbi:MAG: hypothetical protein Kow0098_27100 [Ignavibacteriaceae bacterium]